MAGFPVENPGGDAPSDISEFDAGEHAMSADTRPFLKIPGRGGLRDAILLTVWWLAGQWGISKIDGWQWSQKVESADWELVVPS